MKSQLAVFFVFGAVMGGILTTFLGQGTGIVLSILARLFVAIFFSGALGYIALGMAIGVPSGLCLSGWATAVFRHNLAIKPEAKQPTFGNF